MHFNIGNDIIEIDRIEKAIERQGDVFLNALFTSQEQAYCNRYNQSARHYAGRFAAKEALAKAFGTGISDNTHWLDMEILNDAMGKPYVVLHGKLKEMAKDMMISITISHCKAYASAVALIVSTRYAG